jgi:hypothetical protein
MSDVSGKAGELKERAHREVGSDRGSGRLGGLGLGGILVILGIILALTWSGWAGLLIALVGLIAFGGFAKGKWY